MQGVSGAAHFTSACRTTRLPPSASCPNPAAVPRRHAKRSAGDARAPPTARRSSAQRRRAKRAKRRRRTLSRATRRGCWKSGSTPPATTMLCWASRGEWSMWCLLSEGRAGQGRVGQGGPQRALPAAECLPLLRCASSLTPLACVSAQVGVCSGGEEGLQEAGPAAPPRQAQGCRRGAAGGGGRQVQTGKWFLLLTVQTGRQGAPAGLAWQHLARWDMGAHDSCHRLCSPPPAPTSPPLAPSSAYLPCPPLRSWRLLMCCPTKKSVLCTTRSGTSRQVHARACLRQSATSGGRVSWAAEGLARLVAAGSPAPLQPTKPSFRPPSPRRSTTQAGACRCSATRRRR